MVALLALGTIALMLGLLGLLADRFGIDTRDGTRDAHARRTR